VVAKSKRSPRRKKTREKKSPRGFQFIADVADCNALPVAAESDGEKEEPPIEFCNVKTDYDFEDSTYSESIPTTSAPLASGDEEEPPLEFCNVKTEFAFEESTNAESTPTSSATTSTPMVALAQQGVAVGVPVSMPVYYQPMMAVAVPMPVGYAAPNLPIAQTSEDLVAVIHGETGYDLEDLKALHEKGVLQQIPRNDDGQITSVGSFGHQGDGSQCAPCVFWFKNSCGKGINCAYCHFRHEGQKTKRIRPSKKTREKMKAESSSTASDISDSEARLPGRKVK
jgi:hypothetical protein